jgi:Aspartyl protease
MPPAPFQAVTIKFKGRAGKLITPIAVSQAFNPARPPQPLPHRVETSALWDTGATGSVISTDLAKSLGLVPVGRANVKHAGGSSASPTYLVSFTLPNQVTVAGNLVTEFPSLPGDFSVIIGMDVITFGDFSVTNVGGETWMSFRVPSCVAIDYVAEAQRLQFAGVGRNDPCPCGKEDGAGKRIKFKRCHGA